MDHERFMRAALRLARKGIGLTSPNPAVGAVIVKKGKVIAGGYHRKAGLPHAEIEALGSVRGSLKGAVLYVTLEPCCCHGRTPPCTDAIIESGIKEVVVGAIDPNPGVSGKGVKALASSGIKVRTGVLEGRCREINEGYEKFITTGRPFVILKLASSLDGRIATKSGESRWITGASSRRYVHMLRSAVDAVMVGGSTVIKDDPQLTVRVRGAGGKDPARVVLDTSLKIPFKARVFKGIDKTPLYIFTTKRARAEKIRQARALGSVVLTLRETKRGVGIKGVIGELGRRGITSLMIEGGGRLAASAVKEGVVDKVFFFISPIILGADATPSIAPLAIRSLKDAPRLKKISVAGRGGDIVVEGYL